MPAESAGSTPPQPHDEPPRFTVALAVAALSDDEARKVWEKSEYVVTWSKKEGQEIVWLERETKLPLVFWDQESALKTLAFVLSVEYDATVDLAFPYATSITGDDLVAFVLGCRSGLSALICQDIP